MQSRTGALLMMGRLIIGSLGLVKSKLAKAACAQFIKAHTELVAAEKVVREADAGVRSASEKVIAADVVQDSATLALAARLAGDGGDRINPFKAYGVTSASKLVKRGHLRQARALLLLAEGVLASATSSQASKTAAEAMREAALALISVYAERSFALEVRTQAISARDAKLPQAWRTALSNLRASLRYADSTEGTSSYALVFAGLTPAKVKRPKKVVEAKASERSR